MRDSFLIAYINPFRTIAVAVIVLFVQLSIFGQSSQTNKVRSLSPNETIEDLLSGGQAHRYQVKLVANEFLQVRAEQKGIDVVLVDVRTCT